jgi:hypothetical protein
MSDHLSSEPVLQSPDLLPAVAFALGTSRVRAEAAVRGPLNLALRCARIIDALKAAGADEDLVHFLLPIDLAVCRARPAEVAADLVAEDPALFRAGQVYLDGIYRELGILPPEPALPLDPRRPLRVSGAPKKRRAHRARARTKHRVS